MAISIFIMQFETQPFIEMPVGYGLLSPQSQALDEVHSTRHKIPPVEKTSNAVIEQLVPHDDHVTIALMDTTCLADLGIVVRCKLLMLYYQGLLQSKLASDSMQ